MCIQGGARIELVLKRVSLCAACMQIIEVPRIAGRWLGVAARKLALPLPLQDVLAQGVRNAGSSSSQRDPIVPGQCLNPPPP